VEETEFFMYVDTHCHIDFNDFDKDRDHVLKRAEEEGVNYIIDIGIDIQTSRKAVELAEKKDFIYAVCGIHPSDVQKLDVSQLKEIEQLAKSKKVVGIGETGLDFSRSREFEKEQIDFFKAQVNLAGKLNLPLIIHQRDAKNEILDILETVQLPEKVVMHCFGGDSELADYCEKKNIYVSFTGIVTFKNAKLVKKAAEKFPLEKIMAETDAPFLSPHPYRGKRNEPARVRFIVEEIARLKKKDRNETAKIIFDNSLHFFKIGITPNCR
jgi:TatD DNase family protein